MRRRVLGHAGPSVEAINVTPLIDVVMCLIIFFLIVGKLAQDRLAVLKLPTTIAGSADPAPATVIINIAQGGKPAGPPPPGAPWNGTGAIVTVDQQAYATEAALEALLAAEAAIKPGLVVHIRADRDLPFNGVDPVLKACQSAGIRSVKLAAEKGT